MTARHFLKRGFENAFSSATVTRFTRYRVRGKCLIVAYHGIIPTGEEPVGDRALFVKQEEFAKQLDLLQTCAEVVSLEALDAQGDGRPRVAITFDDAYQGAVEEGVRELVKRGLPATIFVAPGRLGGHVFWWDALAQIGPSFAELLRPYALSSLCGDDEKIREWAASANLTCSTNLPRFARTSTRSELETAVAFPGITLGSHSWSHANLASLSDAHLEEELIRPLQWLTSAFGDRVIPWLAYPYGLDSAEVRRAVSRAGYTGALGINGGWHQASSELRFARPRLNISSGLSVAGLRARLAGAPF